jgi:Tfp pilus assembly protein PilF
MMICSNCGTPLGDALKFCSECGAASPAHAGTALAQSAAIKPSAAASVETNPVGSSRVTDYSQNNPPPPTQNEYSQAFPPSTMPSGAHKSRTVMLVLGLTMFAAIAIIGLFVVRSRFSSTSQSPDGVSASLEGAIQNGRLVTLSSDDAYTYYFRLQNLDPQHRSLSEVKSRVLPQLRTIADDIFRKRVDFSLELITEQEWTRAMRAYEWAHALEPSDKSIEARWKYAAGDLARIQGRIDEAQANLYAATQLDPLWAPAQNDLGYLHVLNKRYTDAIPYYQRAINLQSNWDIPYNGMGTAYFRLEQYDVAESWYKKAIAVNGRWAAPHAWLGSIYENKKLYEAAIEEYQTVLNLFDAKRDHIDITEIRNRVSMLQRGLKPVITN